MAHNPKYPVTFFVKPVIAHFIGHPEKNKDSSGEPNSKPENVDERIPFVPEQVSKSRLQIIWKHDNYFNLLVIYFLSPLYRVLSGNHL
jgi:hypothetical protein